MSRLSGNPDFDLDAHICALRYRGFDEPACSVAGWIALIAVKRGAQVDFYVSPSLLEQIPASEQPYVQELLRDFAHRARTGAEALFNQICSLSTGPLVTESVTHLALGQADLAALYPGFLPISEA